MRIPFRAVIFDIDGTLVESNDAHASAWMRALADAGHYVSFEQVRPLIGKGGDKLLPELTGLDIDSEQGKAIAHQRREIFRAEFLPHLRATRGARDLVMRLRAEGLTLVVATSADEEEVGSLLKVAGVQDMIDAVTSADDAERSKPDPDIVHTALKKAGADAADALMIGDTPYDIDAAHRAGVRILAVRCGGWWKDADLQEAEAIYNDPADLLGEAWVSDHTQKIAAARDGH